MPKPRINLRLTPDMHRRLKEVAAPTGVTINQVVEQALEGFFDPLGASAHAAGVTARLIRLESQLSSLERDLVQANETLALFVQYWLTATPPLPDIDRNTAHALGQKRFNRFMDQVADAIATTG